MKRFLSLILLLATVCVGFAASPSFDSFNTNQFVVSASKIISDRLWTNNAGTIQASSAVSAATEATGFKLDTVNTPALDGTVFHPIAFKTVGTNYLDVVVRSYANSNRSVQTELGFVTHTVTEGIASDTSLNTYIESGTNRFGEVQLLLLNGPQFDYYVGETAVVLDALGGADVGYRELFMLDPYLDYDVGVPYLYDTAATVSSGNLADWRNNATNKFSVNYLGALIPSGNTNQITTGSGRLKYDAVNVPTISSTDVFSNKSFSDGVTVLGASTLNTITANSLTVTGAVAATSMTIGGVSVATFAGITNVETFALSDMTTALTTGTNKNYWYAPSAGMTIKFVRLTLATTSSSGTPTVDINEAGATILSTKLTVDVGEWDSFTAATPPVISDSAIAANAKVDFDIDVAGTGAAGAQVQIGFTVP